jgi:hypothetical protein
VELRKFLGSMGSVSIEFANLLWRRQNGLEFTEKNGRAELLVEMLYTTCNLFWFLLAYTLDEDL